MSVWAVVYSNYSPAEIDSIFACEQTAVERVEYLNNQATAGYDDWHVIEWEVGECK